MTKTLPYVILKVSIYFFCDMPVTEQVCLSYCQVHKTLDG